MVRWGRKFFTLRQCPECICDVPHRRPFIGMVTRAWTSSEAACVALNGRLARLVGGVPRFDTKQKLLTLRNIAPARSAVDRFRANEQHFREPEFRWYHNTEYFPKSTASIATLARLGPQDSICLQPGWPARLRSGSGPRRISVAKQDNGTISTDQIRSQKIPNLKAFPLRFFAEFHQRRDHGHRCVATS